MAAKPVNPPPAAAGQHAHDAAVYFVPSGKGYEILVTNEADLDDEVMEALLRAAADKVSGKDDRAAGCWGSPSR